jgi:hypothetical protein
MTKARSVGARSYLSNSDGGTQAIASCSSACGSPAARDLDKTGSETPIGGPAARREPHRRSPPEARAPRRARAWQLPDGPHWRPACRQGTARTGTKFVCTATPLLLLTRLVPRSSVTVAAPQRDKFASSAPKSRPRPAVVTSPATEAHQAKAGAAKLRALASSATPYG